MLLVEGSVNPLHHGSSSTSVLFVFGSFVQLPHVCSMLVLSYLMLWPCWSLKLLICSAMLQPLICTVLMQPPTCAATIQPPIVVLQGLLHDCCMAYDSTHWSTEMHVSETLYSFCLDDRTALYLP